MTLSQEQLEWIVAEVVRRLRAATPIASTPTATPAREIVLTERLITTETLRGRLSEGASVRVPAKVVITPAAVDLLKEKQIELVRG